MIALVTRRWVARPSASASGESTPYNTNSASAPPAAAAGPGDSRDRAARTLSTMHVAMTKVSPETIAWDRGTQKADNWLP